MYTWQTTLNYDSFPGNPQYADIEAQIQIWVSEGKTDGVITYLPSSYEDRIGKSLSMSRVWIDQAAADEYFAWCDNFYTTYPDVAPTSRTAAPITV